MRSGLSLRSVIGPLVAGLTLACLVQPAGALEISKHAKDSAETNAVLLKGKIDDGDTYELQVYMAGLPKKPNVVVYLNSGGGNLREGMRLGRFFFHNKIETVVEPKRRNARALADWRSSADAMSPASRSEPRRRPAASASTPSRASSTRTRAIPPTISRPSSRSRRTRWPWSRNI